MKVRDLMTSPAQCLNGKASLAELARVMKESDIGAVPICEGDNLLGIVTDRDIVIRAIAGDRVPESLCARDIMSPNPATVCPDADVHEAADLMAKQQIRRLPVLQQGKLVGMLALGDLATETIHINEAGDALSTISQGIHH